MDLLRKADRVLTPTKAPEDALVERLTEELVVHDECCHPGMIGHGLVQVRADDLRAILAARDEQTETIKLQAVRLMELSSEVTTLLERERRLRETAAKLVKRASYLPAHMSNSTSVWREDFEALRAALTREGN